MGCAASKANEKHFQYFVSIDDETGIFKLATNDKNVFWSLIKAKKESAQFQLVKAKKESAQFQLGRSSDMSSRFAGQQSSSQGKRSTSEYGHLQSNEFNPSHQRLIDLLTGSMFLNEMRKKGNQDRNATLTIFNLWLQINSSLKKAYIDLGITSDEKEEHKLLLEELRTSERLYFSAPFLPWGSDLHLGTIALMTARLNEAYRKRNNTTYKTEQMIKDLQLTREEAEKRSQYPYYDTTGKKGLLCIIQVEQNWIEGNKKDNDVLMEFFKDTLGFDVMEYSNYRQLDKNLEWDIKLSSQKYYCLLICISSHGNETEVITEIKRDGEKEELEWETFVNIKKRFGNKKIQTLAGVPKMIILDTCRGKHYNKTVKQDGLPTKSLISAPKRSISVSPTTDSDCLIVHATTHGHIAFIPSEIGSVGIQCVMGVFKANWEKDHVEEMLIDARMEVANHKTFVENKDARQTLEIQTTLTRRLKFMACH